MLWREGIVQLTMQSQSLLIVGIRSMLDITTGLGIVIVIHVLSSVHVLITGREKETELVPQHSVAIRKRSDEVGQGCFGIHMQVLHSEI